MAKMEQYSREELLAAQRELKARYQDFQAKGLKLDMSRGKPGADQLELTMGMMDLRAYRAADGMDCRNYGGLEGLPECRKLFADMLETTPEHVLIGGNSSLTMMFDFVTQCMLHGMGGEPWSRQGAVKFLCPVPGYDRHFTICQYLGIEMVNVPMNSEGPDMETIEELIKDPLVKGMFCVPKYSNPTGITYSDAVVRRIAAMKPAAEDFRIIWDNAYCVHHLTDTPDRLLNILDECEKAGNPDMPIVVASTSKISFPGAGVAALAASLSNIARIKGRMAMQTISNDKLNQLRHVQFFRDLDGVKAHMKKHAAIIAPKFQIVLDALEKELGGKGIASWEKPRGGYFISLDVLPGSASLVGRLCKEAGVTLTSVGATFPYGKDPKDENIRIAPTFPPVEELKLAVELLCICVQLAAIETLLK